MSYKVLLPQPILPEGYAYLRDHGYEVVDGRGFAEEDVLACLLYTSMGISAENTSLENLGLGEDVYKRQHQSRYRSS